MKYFSVILTLVLTAFLMRAVAQPSVSKMKSNLDLQNKLQPAGLRMTVSNLSQAGILFSPKTSLRSDQSAQWLGTQLDLRQGIDAISVEGTDIQTGDVSISKLHQYYKDIKVEHGVIHTTNKNGLVSMMEMEYYPIDEKFKTTPVLTEQQALQKAMDFTGAVEYAWSGDDSAKNAPHGELVIVQTYLKPGELCLAYKFDIYALRPLSRAYVYVNAWNGMVVLNDPIIKHATRGENKGLPLPPPGQRPLDSAEASLINTTKAHHQDIPAIEKQPVEENIPLAAYSNSPASATTRFLGQRQIFTDNNSGITGSPYRLRATYNNHDIVTLNYTRHAGNLKQSWDPNATDFVDNDNNWTAAEFDNPDLDNAALDVQFNMQVVSDYWLNVHQRHGWDNNNSEIRSYVHVEEYKQATDGNYYKYPMANAYWAKGTMHFGDGSLDLAKSQPYNTLDICGHEMGHAITETTSSLVYQWESGALNESFSDIWAACITNYAKLHVTPAPTGEITWRVAEKCENLDQADKGFRDMSNPGLFKHPGTYQNAFWVPATLPTCRDFANTDNCGVHTNSGVLNKWFFLITDGENSFNSFGRIYNIKGLGFAVSQKIAYLTSANLPPNATYQTARIVSIDATEALYGAGSVELQTVKDAWVAVALDSNIYNMSNTPVFTTNNFTTIAVGAKGDVWAGTNYNGLYHYDGKNWELRPEVPNVRINDIKADKAGNIWIAQSGTQSGGSQAQAGGVNYLKAPYGASDAYFYTIGAQTNIPSRNARNIFIDTTRTNDGANPKVWVATLAYITSGNSTSGMLGQGLYSSSRYFHNVSEGLNIASGTAGILTTGGNAAEIWAFAQANNGINQLLTYDAGTNAFLTYYDHNTDPVIPSGFVARSIYGDARKRIWIPLANNGLMVLDENRNFHNVVLPANVFPAAAQPSFNAIAGDRYGDIYIGTNAGILFFDRGDGTPGNIDNPDNYKVFSKVNGLPSNQVNAVAYDTLRFKLMVATDSGVVFFEPFCVAPYCKVYTTKSNVSAETLSSGNWSDPKIWSNNKVPDSLTIVSLKHNVLVDINGECKSLAVASPGAVTVKSGMKLVIYEEDATTIYSRRKAVKSVGGKLKKVDQ